MPSSEVPLIRPIARQPLSVRSPPCGEGSGWGWEWEFCGPGGTVMLDDAAMSTPRSNFLAAAIERGFVHQCTDLDALDGRMSAGRVAAYVGYDCTADSLHIGSLVGIM